MSFRTGDIMMNIDWGNTVSSSHYLNQYRVIIHTLIHGYFVLSLSMLIWEHYTVITELTISTIGSSNSNNGAIPHEGYGSMTMPCAWIFNNKATLIARFMGPTWGPPGANRTLVGPILAPLSLLSGKTMLAQKRTINEVNRNTYSFPFQSQNDAFFSYVREDLTRVPCSFSKICMDTYTEISYRIILCTIVLQCKSFKDRITS